MKKIKITAALLILAMLLSIVPAFADEQEIIIGETEPAASAAAVYDASNTLDFEIKQSDTNKGRYTVSAKLPTSGTTEVNSFTAVQFNVANVIDGDGPVSNLRLTPASGFTLQRIPNTHDEGVYSYQVRSIDTDGITLNNYNQSVELFTIELVNYGKGTITLSGIGYTKTNETETGDIAFTNISQPYDYAAERKPFNVEIDFNNALKSNAEQQTPDYTKMTVTVSGGMLTAPIVKELDAKDVTNTDGKQTLTVPIKETVAGEEQDLDTGWNYIVTVEGEGYRTAVKSVLHTPAAPDGTTVKFWNNVFATAPAGETEKTNFLAGDIQMDGSIGLYDLNAVTSYYGYQPDTGTKSNYIQYDLNRDGKINAADIALVLVSWGE